MPVESPQFDFVRCRAWPCDECSGGTSYLDLIVRRHETSGTVSEGSADEVIEKHTALERVWLREWCESCSHQPAFSALLPKLDEGSEHLVYFVDGPPHGLEDHVIKVTKPGLFGDSYYLEDGRIHQRRCTPGDYLVRMEMIRRLFGFAPIPLGVTSEGQIVSKQKFVRGEPPTQVETDAFLMESGLEPVKQDCFVWKRVDSEGRFEWWVGDARDENFVKTENGIVPIDLRMWGVPFGEEISGNGGD